MPSGSLGRKHDQTLHAADVRQNLTQARVHILYTPANTQGKHSVQSGKVVHSLGKQCIVWETSVQQDIVWEVNSLREQCIVWESSVQSGKVAYSLGKQCIVGESSAQSGKVVYSLGKQCLVSESSVQSRKNVLYYCSTTNQLNRLILMVSSRFQPEMKMPERSCTSRVRYFKVLSSH